MDEVNLDDGANRQYFNMWTGHVPRGTRTLTFIYGDTAQVYTIVVQSCQDANVSGGASAQQNTASQRVQTTFNEAQRMCSRKETVREVPGSGGKRHRLRDSRRPHRCESPDDTPQRVSTYADEALCNWFL